MDDDKTLSTLLGLIASDKITEIEAERLINALARLSCHVPTGMSDSPDKKHIHTL